MFFNITSLSDLKRAKWVHNHIIWDIEPKQLMEPKYKQIKEGKEDSKTIAGYLFYIDKMGKKPALFLMLHTAMGYAETVAKIDEIPEELILEAIEENKNKEFFGMCPINKRIEEWLKKELGIKEDSKLK
ncbi:MAG: DVU0772 family protein [Thermodesulfovibrionales bacterium]